MKVPCVVWFARRRCAAVGVGVSVKKGLDRPADAPARLPFGNAVA
jgi:hypothetical protein